MGKPTPQDRDTLSHVGFRVGRQRLARLQRVDPVTDQIKTIEKSVHDVGRQRNLANANFCKQILRRVHQVGQRRDIEETRRPLQRMHGAKHVVDHGLRGRVLLQRQHSGPGLLEKVARFGDELGKKGVHATALSLGAEPVMSLTKTSSSAGPTGLTR